MNFRNVRKEDVIKMITILLKSYLPDENYEFNFDFNTLFFTIIVDHRKKNYPGGCVDEIHKAFNVLICKRKFLLDLSLMLGFKISYLYEFAGPENSPTLLLYVTHFFNIIE